jgi:hypothetical protein
MVGDVWRHPRKSPDNQTSVRLVAQSLLYFYSSPSGGRQMMLEGFSIFLLQPGAKVVVTKVPIVS